jgi:hypothetical protein
MRTLLTTLISATLLASTAQAQDTSWVGRWVNVEEDFTLFVVNIESDGRVQVLIPAPRFSATYLHDADRVLIRFADGGTDSSFAVTSDTSARWGEGALIRVSPGAGRESTARGTWRTVPAGPMNAFMTFRPDGVVVLEVGFPEESQLKGNTLRLSSDQWPTRSLAIRRDGDTLYVAEEGRAKRRFVVRPWGCFGFDGEGEQSGC